MSSTPDGVAPDASAGTFGDPELIERSRRGDAQAFAELWKRYATLALATARPLAPSTADDVVSDVFEDLWQRLQRGGGPDSNVRGYILAAVRNTAARDHRWRQRHVTGTEFDVDAAAEESDLTVAEENRREVASAFASLPERWRRVLWLLEVERRSRGEVASELGLSPNSVSVLARRAREGLRLAWLETQLPLDADAEHSTYLRQLPRYVRGSLSRPEQAGVRSHLRSCVACARQARELRVADGQLRGRRKVAALVLVLVGYGSWELVSPAGTAVPASALTAAAPNSSAGLWLGSGWQLTGATARAGLIAAATVAAVVVTTVVMPPMPQGSAPGDTAVADTRSVPEQSAAVGGSSGTSQPGGKPGGTRRTASPGTTPAPTPTRTGATTQPAPRPTGSTSGGGTVPKPTEPTRPDVVAKPFTYAGSATGGGAYPPTLSGSGTPGATVTVDAAGRARTTTVSATGSWSIDLAADGPLSVGSYTAAITYQLAAQAAQTASYGFSIAVPSITYYRDPAQNQPVQQMMARGIPGEQICFQETNAAPRTFRLNGAGEYSFTSQGPLTGNSIRYQYCEGSRAGAGVSTTVSVFT